jgi:hypothetical protein
MDTQNLQDCLESIFRPVLTQQEFFRLGPLANRTITQYRLIVISDDPQHTNTLLNLEVLCVCPVAC